MDPPQTGDVKNDQNKAELDKQKPLLARRSSRSKLKRIKCLSPSSSAKKAKQDSTSTGDMAEAEPMREESQTMMDSSEIDNHHDDGTCHDPPEKKPKRKKRKKNSNPCRSSGVDDSGIDPPNISAGTKPDGDQAPADHDAHLGPGKDSAESNDKPDDSERACREEEEKAKERAAKDPVDLI